MSNNFDSNFTRQLAKVILKSFDTNRVLSKNVDTQLLDGRYSKSDTGEYVDFKRPTDYRSVRTATGDVSGETKSDIITGRRLWCRTTSRCLSITTTADKAIKMAQKENCSTCP